MAYFNQGRFWPITSIIFGAIALLKGARLPNDWAATQAQVDYSSGFIKRGLWGEILNGIGAPIYHYVDFAILSFALFALMIMTLAWRVRQAQCFKLLDDGIAVGLFFSSFALTYFSHLMGYLDIPLIMLAIFVISTPHPKVLLVATAGVIGALIHEAYAVLLFPLTILPLLIRLIETHRQGATQWRSVLVLLIAAAPVITVVFFIAWHAPMTPLQVGDLQHSIEQRVDFKVREDFFAVLSRSAEETVSLMKAYSASIHWKVDQLYGAFEFFPTAAVFLWFSTQGIWARYKGRDRTLLLAVVTGCSLSPILLNITGSDIFRWDAFLVLTSFLTMTIVCRDVLALDGSALALSPWERNLIVLLIGLNLATAGGFMDKFPGNSFPFRDLAKNIVTIVSQKSFPNPYR